jgi:phosphoglycolate phosphatase-like HAD superfamily hydrolase
VNRLILFDVDGTLVDALGAGRAAIGTAMTAVFGEAGPLDDFDFHGRTDPSIVRGLLRAAGWDDEPIDSVMPDVWEVYYRQLDDELARRVDHVRVYPGVSRLLDELEKDAGYAIGLVTGNMEEGAKRKLAAGGLEHRFAFGAYGSDSERREDLPPVALQRAQRLLGRTFDMTEAVVIGDTPEDIRCARANGAKVVCVATGRHSEDELAAYDPDAIFRDLSDTGEVMSRIAELERGGVDAMRIVDDERRRMNLEHE